jgi:hypothetical protein
VPLRRCYCSHLSLLNLFPPKQYAYRSFHPTETDVLLVHNDQLNGDKSEIIWFGSHTNLRALAGQDLTLPIGSDVIQPHSVVRDLGVWLDSELTLHHHITKLAAVCFHNLRRLRQLRRRLGQDVTTRLVVALISSRLDYCNSVFASLPQSSISSLQRVQNAAARLVFSLRPRDSVTPALIQLHWLPVQFRIRFKLCTIMYRIRTGSCPQYLVILYIRLQLPPPVPVFAPATVQTSASRGCAPNLESALSLTLDLAPGTLSQRPFVLRTL